MSDAYGEKCCSRSHHATFSMWVIRLGRCCRHDSSVRCMGMKCCSRSCRGTASSQVVQNSSIDKLACKVRQHITHQSQTCCTNAASKTAVSHCTVVMQLVWVAILASATRNNGNNNNKINNKIDNNNNDNNDDIDDNNSYAFQLMMS